MFAASLPAGAAEAPLRVEGLLFERRIRLGGSELLLNGTGIRAVAWFKGYVAALYLSARASTPAGVLATPGPKRLRMHMLHGVATVEFVNAFRKGVSRNAAADELPRLAERMERFAAQVSALGNVDKGDIVDLDFEPGRGLTFIVNGKIQGDAIAGEDFYAALLRAFVGDKPYDKKLKAGLLGLAV
ncbi:MAG: chalcone isomerase family protein [Rubrivivax sp.]|nr:chalcone isomerase family protein [Rubrivivax sp.]